MDYKKQFISKFNEACYMHDKAEVWNTFVVASACALRNVMPVPNKEKYEQEYSQVLSKFKDISIFPELLTITVLALEENSEQDFLGEIYQQLGLCDTKSGQVFTPYHVAELMSEMTLNNSVDNGKDWFSVADPSVGSGVMLIAAANVYRKRGKNFQTDILFVGQDINRTLALTTYVQLSLLGCAGYVVVGDSLLAKDSVEEQEIWYTPMFFRSIWLNRRQRKKQ